jgi:hypothetical protein
MFTHILLFLRRKMVTLITQDPIEMAHKNCNSQDPMEMAQMSKKK